MPVQGTSCTPVCSETCFWKSTSRPPNIAVGSTIVRTARSRPAATAAHAASCSPASDQLGHVWRAHARAYATLDLEPVPELYLTAHPIANALTIGAGQPLVVVNSELVQLIDADQLRGVFAHEAGHVLSEHVLYRTALVILLRLSALPGIPLPLFPLKAALLEWFRAAELSCHRAPAPAIRGPLAVCRTLMVLAAGAQAANLDLDVFMAQGQEYREKASPFDRFSRLLSDLNLTHP